MTVVGAFTTDWSQEPVVDEWQSQVQGKQVFVPGQQRLSHGGTFWNRGSMPLMEMGKHDDWEVFLSWTFRTAADGSIEMLDVATNEYRRPDVVYTQRWMSEEAPEQYRRARAASQKVVCDLDDDFWKLDKTNIAYHTTDPANNPSFNRAHYWESLKECDAITVSTEALRKRVEPLGKPTYILRNAIDIEQWEPNDPGADGMIGWVGGIQWRSHDLAQLRCANINDFLRRESLPIYHGGDSQVPGVPKFYEQMGIDPTQVQCAVAPLCHIAMYPQLWKPINISLIPLENVYFNHAKSWLKQLESCAAGIPYIVSAKFPEQRLLMAEGTAGREARNDKPQQWIDHLYDLMDPDLRREEGKINRAIAEQHDIRLKWHEWADAYAEVVAA